MEPLTKASDLPNAKTGDICSMIEQRAYTVTNYLVNGQGVPQFLQSGTYKVSILLMDENKVVTSQTDVFLYLS